MSVPAPYPSDTRAKGWRFEIDHERIRQSDTWALASIELRPWLLMIWMVAWEQTPCGSLPDDDLLIAARIGMPVDLFIAKREILLRKWWKAEDGRLYHEVIILRVHEMLVKRAKDAKRAAKSRGITDESQDSHALVTRDTPVTHSGVRGESEASPRRVRHQAPSTSKDTPITPKGARAVSFKTWAEEVRAAGEKLIPDDDPVFDYATEVGIPHEYVALAWAEFKARHVAPGAKRYKDFRQAFRNSIRANWYKLWLTDGDSYKLSTTGLQAQKAKEAMPA